MSKRLAFMEEAERMTAKAFWVWSEPQVDPTRRFMRLMYYAKKSLDDSPTVPRNLFEALPFDLLDEAKHNKELHANMDFMRLMLKEKSYYVVEPETRIARADGKSPTSPLEYAQELGKDYPPLEKWLTEKLLQQQKKLLYFGHEFPRTGQSSVSQELFRRKPAP